MKYLVTFNVLDKRTGRPTPLKVSCEFKDVSRQAAVRAMLQYVAKHDIHVNTTPSSIKSVGAPPRPRARTKISLPDL